MEERNLSPEVLEMLKLRYARVQAYKQLADIEAGDIQRLLKKIVGVDLVHEQWELDLERGVLRRVSSQPE